MKPAWAVFVAQPWWLMQTAKRNAVNHIISLKCSDADAVTKTVQTDCSTLAIKYILLNSYELSHIYICQCQYFTIGYWGLYVVLLNVKTISARRNIISLYFALRRESYSRRIILDPSLFIYFYLRVRANRKSLLFWLPS